MTSSSEKSGSDADSATREAEEIDMVWVRVGVSFDMSPVQNLMFLNARMED